MELATNLFTKGLLMDTNPMILGNDTLTDCLNGTLITMNGNEVILQNDMGNRRVDNAFLPPGYEPVGIKEYGGIIYVAAYNPITNKSLIGSFPSPEKRLSKEDDPNLGGNFDFDKFFDDKNVYTDLDLGFISNETYCGIKVIKTDSFMVPLTKDTSLRAGDKFVVYGTLSDLKNLITNYENTCFAVKHDILGLKKVLISDDYSTLVNTIINENDKIDKPTDIIARGRSENTTNNNTSGNKIVITKKVISPKNRKYTLQLGILNSQNEFVDITKTLVRWKGPKVVEYNDNVSELYKFNDGYFIPDSFTNPGLGETISDAQLIRDRLTITANTYSYKLIGPLYLKINLNHIVRFNYNIYGIFTDYVAVDQACPGGLGTRSTPIVEPINNISQDCSVSETIYLGYSKVFLGGLLVRKLRLWVEGYITYNCPDNDNSVSNSIISSRILLDKLESNDENYATYEELDPRPSPGTAVYDFFDFMHGVRVERPLSIINKLDPTSTKRTKAVYNPDTNLYTIKVTKEYLIDNVSTDDTYDYIIGVLTSFDEDNIYLRDLSCKGSLNLSLLGSGNVDITGWRFYNDVELRVTLLTVAFEAYPELNTRFENLNFNFKDITRIGETGYEGINYGGLPLYNGRQTYTIDWGDDFEPRKVYAVKITYDVVDEDGNVSHRTLNDYWSELDLSTGKYIYHNIYRWLLTTELFNEFYQSTSGISDFCDLREVDLEIATAFENKMHVNLHCKSDIVDKTKYSEKFEGGLVSKTNNISYICNHQYNISLIINPEISIIDEELYPDFIKVEESKKNSIDIDTVPIKSIGSVDISEGLDSSSIINNAFKDLLLEIKGTSNTNSLTSFDTASLSLLTFNPIVSLDKKNVGGTIIYKDIYKGYSSSVVPELYNVFDRLSNIINEALPPDGYFCGIVVQADDNGNPNHFVRVGRFSTSQTATLSGDAGINCDYVNIKTDHRHKKQFYSFSPLAAKIYLEFNNSLSTPGQMFLYLYTTETNDNKYKFDDSSQWETDVTRLWWRTAENEWATFNDILTKKNDNTPSGQDNIKNFILGKVKNYVYRMYDVYVNDGSLKIYAADLDYTYYDGYNIPLTMLINYKLLRDSNNNDNIILVLEGLNNQWGNLQFSLSIEDVKSNEVTFDLKSSDIFHDAINTFDKDHVSNIDLNTGSQIDSLNQKLTPDSIYYYTYNSYNRTEESFSVWTSNDVDNNDPIGYFETYISDITVDNNTGIETKTTTRYRFNNVPKLDSLTYNNYYSQYSTSREIIDGPTITTTSLTPKIVKINNPYFTTDSHNTINGKNTLVYNKYSFGRPNYCYQGAHISETDDETILYYNAVNIIKNS